MNVAAMGLYQIKRKIAPEQVDDVETRLLEHGEAGWSVGQDVLAGTSWVLGIFETEAAARAAWAAVRAVFPDWPEATEVSELPDEDWRDSYKAHFKAWQCGRLHWVPEWERETYVLAEGDVAIWLDPGMAFGTGNHETTRLCCERLVEWAKTAPADARVIDAGCGSGILAISAARLGFTRVRGFDNDAEAVAISQENAELNGLGGAVSFYEGDLTTGFQGRAGDLVLANILGHVLVQYVPQLLAAVAPGGVLVLSGILAEEGATVQAAFAAEAAGWEIDRRTLGEWCDVQLRRPGTP